MCDSFAWKKKKKKSLKTTFQGSAFRRMSVTLKRSTNELSLWHVNNLSGDANLLSVASFPRWRIGVIVCQRGRRSRLQPRGVWWRSSYECNLWFLMVQIIKSRLES